MNSAGFIEHKGEKIFVIDFYGLSKEELLEMITEAAGQIRVQPPKSVLTLTNVAGAPDFDIHLVKALKDFTLGNKPFVAASAIVGVSGLQKVVLDAVTRFSDRTFFSFGEMEKAKDFLAGFLD